MASKESKVIRNDLILIGGALVAMLGACIVLATLLGRATDEPSTPSPGGESDDVAIAPEEMPRGLHRIAVPDAFSDTTASEESESNDVGERWLRVGVGEGGTDALLLRFPIELSSTAEIEFATIELTSTKRGWLGGQGRARLRITLLDSDDQQPFSSTQYPTDLDLLGIPPAGTFVEWETGPWYPGEIYKTSDISSLVRSFIAREGYAPGNHLALRIAPDPRVQADERKNLFEAESRDGGKAPVLVIQLAVEDE